MGCLKTITYVLIAWMVILCLYELGYKNTVEHDIDIPEVKAVPVEFDSSLLKEPSTKPYRGVWIDVE